MTGTVIRIMTAAVVMLACRVAAAQPAPTRVTDYQGTVWGIAVGVEAGGRAHVLWTGKRPSDSSFTAFYSSSADGATWAPYQVLDSGDAFDPQIAVDDVHGRVHLVYRSNTNGIVHRIVTAGVPSAATVVDLTGVVFPVLAVNPSTGNAYLTWQKWDSGYTFLSGMYSRWDGTGWSAPVEPVTGATWSSIAVSPAGAVMLGGLAGDTYARSTLAADGVSFAAPVQAAAAYPWPEEDDTAAVAYNHADSSFHLAANHLLWPGSSETYHWVWTGSAWSGPDNLSQSATDTWSVREYLGSVESLPYLFVAWMESGDDIALLARTWQDGAVSEAVDIGHLFTDAGVVLNTAGTHHFCLDAGGSPHVAVGEAAYQDLGVYYLALDRLDLLFADGFESGSASAWTLHLP